MSLRLLCFVLSCLLFSPVFSQVPGIDSSNLPLVVINTNGKTIIDASKITATMKIISNGAGQLNKPSDLGNIYSGYVGIEIRGAWSSTLPQKPYGFETRDASGATLMFRFLECHRKTIGFYWQTTTIKPSCGIRWPMTYLEKWDIMRHAPKWLK